MADWRGVSEGIQRGFERGFSTGGGRLGHLGGLIKQVADKLRTERETQQAFSEKQALMNMELAKQKELVDYEAKAKLPAQKMELLGKAGFFPVASDKLSEQDIRGMSQEEIGKIMPKGGFTPGEFPANPSLLKLPEGVFKQQTEFKEWKPRTQAEALDFEAAKAGLKKGLTLSGALSILSDPMKAYQLKKTYPQLYKEAEDVVRANLGEEILSGTKQSSPKPKGKLPAKIIPEEDVMDTNW